MSRVSRPRLPLPASANAYCAIPSDSNPPTAEDLRPGGAPVSAKRNPAAPHPPSSNGAASVPPVYPPQPPSSMPPPAAPNRFPAMPPPSYPAHPPVNSQQASPPPAFPPHPSYPDSRASSYSQQRASVPPPMIPLPPNQPAPHTRPDSNGYPRHDYTPYSAPPPSAPTPGPSGFDQCCNAWQSCADPTIRCQGHRRHRFRIVRHLHTSPRRRNSRINTVMLRSRYVRCLMQLQSADADWFVRIPRGPSSAAASPASVSTAESLTTATFASSSNA